ncbi:phage protease [Stenotrophomonas maltophilia]|uniref:phage protease n=1 Tax=Stenotrophomonas maltophilia TaxID=40324 RepID=UPI0039C13B6E
MTKPAQPPIPSNVAVAACSFKLPLSLSDDGTIEMQLTPAGEFRPNDGRELPVPAWYIDAAVAERVIARFNAKNKPLVVDYEHQTLNKETNGQPAPAAAWMRALQWREGSGLWAIADPTTRAAAAIDAKEYLYVSPVFRFDEKTGEVLTIEMAAITNTPAIDDMQALSLRAAATFAFHSETEDHPMNPLLAALLAALKLPATTTEEQAIAACSKLGLQLATLESLTTELGVDEGGALAACSALKTKASAAPDPTKFVPLSAVDEIRGQLAALSEERTNEKVTALVNQGLADGRILPALKDWATDLGKSDIAALNKYLAGAPAIAALSQTQTKGRKPGADEAKDAHGLDASELAVCSMTGISPKDYAAAKPSA